MKRKIFLLSSLGIFLLSLYQILFNLSQILSQKNFIDFLVYWEAVGKFLEGKSPYQFLYGQSPEKIPFNYPPSALILFLPLKIFPPKAAQIILTFFSFLSLWLSLLVILKMAKIKISLSHFLILLAFFQQTFPVKLTLSLGQINLVVLGLTYLSLYLYTRDKIFPVRRSGKSPKTKLLLRCRGGRKNEQYQSAIGINPSLTKKFLHFGSVLFFSFASSFKIFPLFILPVFLILKDYIFVFFVSAIFLALNFLPSFTLFRQYYFQILPDLTQINNQPNFYDQSLLAFLIRLTQNNFWAKYFTLGFLLILYFLILFRFLERKGKSDLYLWSDSVIFALAAIGGLFSWQHHLVFAYPLIFWLYLWSWRSVEPKNKRTLLKQSLPFLTLWLVLAFHFQNENSFLLENPFIASYQTIAILFVIISSLAKN